MFDYLQSEVWSVCLLLFTVVLWYFCLCAVVLLFTVVLWYGLFVYCCLLFAVVLWYMVCLFTVVLKFLGAGLV